MGNLEFLRFLLHSFRERRREEFQKQRDADTDAGSLLFQERNRPFQAAELVIIINIINIIDDPKTGAIVRA